MSMRAPDESSAGEASNAVIGCDMLANCLAPSIDRCSPAISGDSSVSGK